MPERVIILPQPVHAPTGGTAVKKQQQPGAGSVSFDQVLGAQLGSGVRFSKHATMRMQSRGIKLDAESLGRLNQAVKLADKKGCRDSLVLLDSTALVVSVRDNTVVTVSDQEQLKGNVFTNIDSAIIA